jgi:hypothetical protein
MAGTVYGGTNLTESGLIGWWKLDETSSPAVDSSSSGNNGTWVGSPSAGTPCPNILFSNLQSILLNGSSQDITVNPSLSTKTEWSISAWINTTKSGDATNYNYIYSEQLFAAANPIMVLNTYNGTNNVARLYVRNAAGTAATASGTTVVNDGNWHHIVGTRSENNFCIYVDGDPEGSSSVSLGSITVDRAKIGRRADYSGITTYHYFLGNIDDLRIYSRCLTLTEIANLYAGGISGTVQLSTIQ